MHSNKIAIIALGWLGEHLYESLESKGFMVSGSYHSTPKDLANTFKFNFNTDNLPSEVLESETIIFNLPPSKIEDDDQFFQFIKNIKSKRLIFVSSTSVYGLQGNVNELTPPKPDSKNGKRLLSFEELIMAQCHSYQIIRPGGLYGKERHPGKYLSGRSDLTGGDLPVNLTGLEDLTAVIHRALKSEESQVINAVNIHHPTKKEFYTSYCEANHLALPIFSDSISQVYKVISTIHKEYEILSDL